MSSLGARQKVCRFLVIWLKLAYAVSMLLIHSVHMTKFVDDCEMCTYCAFLSLQKLQLDSSCESLGGGGGGGDGLVGMPR